MKIVLKDNTEIQVDQATYDKHFIINFDSVYDYQTTWGYFTTNNLADFTLYDDNDEVVKKIMYIRLSSTQAIINPDNTVTGHFYFTGGTEIPNEYEQAGKILMGEEV